MKKLELNYANINFNNRLCGELKNGQYIMTSEIEKIFFNESHKNEIIIFTQNSIYHLTDLDDDNFSNIAYGYKQIINV